MSASLPSALTAYGGVHAGLKRTGLGLCASHARLNQRGGVGCERAKDVINRHCLWYMAGNYIDGELVIELRWLQIDPYKTPPPDAVLCGDRRFRVLQYRTWDCVAHLPTPVSPNNYVTAIAGTPGARWTDWTDVPTVEDQV